MLRIERPLLMLLVLAAISACTEGPRILERPASGDVISAFPPPLELGRPELDSRELTVTLAEPKGKIVELSGINIGFSEPMVASTDVRELTGEVPVTLTPKIAGTFRWLGPRTLSFVPTERPPMATVFHVKLAPGLRSVAGKELAEPFEFSFSTPSLRVARFDPSWYSARLKPDDSIFVQFSLPVREADLQRAMVLTRLEGANAVEVDFTLKPTTKDRAGDPIKRGVAFTVTPTAGFTGGVKYVLKIGSSLSPITGELALGSAWSHTFATYGDFEVRSVRCGYGECGPDDSWMLEFSNPVNAAAIDRCVSISPRVKRGEAYGYGTSVTLNPRNKQPATRYAITVGAGCRDMLGNTLGKSARYVFNVGDYRPSMGMARGVNFMEPPEKGELARLPLTLRNVADARLRMVRLDEDNLSKFLVHFDSWSSDDFFVQSGLTPRVDRSYGLKLTRNHRKTYGVRLDEVLGSARTGLVFVDVSSQTLRDTYEYDASRRALIQLSDVGLTAKTSPESVLVWATSLSSAEPLPSVQVSMRTEDGKVLWTGVTDSSGVVLAPGLDTFGDAKVRTLLAKRGDELSFLDLASWRTTIEPYRFGLNYDWNAHAAEVRGTLFTERGVYRPGETVHVKGFLRYDRGSRLERVPATRVSVTVTDSQDEVVVVRELELSELGAFDLDVLLAKAAKLGTYSVVAKPAGLNGETSGAFRVEAYRAPDFEVNVSTDSDDLAIGDTVEATIAGQYLFGAPMAGATAHWYASRTSTVFRPAHFEDYVFGAQEDRWWWSDSSRDVRGAGEGQGELDDTGSLRASIKLEPDEDVDGPQILTVEAEVTDVNRQVISGRSSVKVHPGSFYIGIHRPGYLVEANKPMVAGVVTVKSDGGQRLTGRKVELNLLKRTWVSVKKASAGGGYTWISERKDVKKAHCSVITKADTAECTFNVPGSGYYVLEARSKDEEGRAIVSTTGVYAWGGGYSWWGASDDERIDLVVDKESYRVGDVAKVMVKSPYREARALVTVERRGILSQRTVELKGSASVIEVPITDEMLPNAFVSVVAIRGRVKVPTADGSVVDPGKPSFKMGYATLNIDKSRQLLEVSIEPEATTYQPGETVRTRLSLRDSSGAPVSGEVTFMAVDEGVLSLTGYKTPDPVQALYRQQPIAVQTLETRTALVAKVAMAEEDGMKGDTGGGGEGGQARSFRSAFATTAAFMPLVKVGSSGDTSVEFVLPDNLTAFRLMAVAVGQGNRFGSSEIRVKVQKPLMVRPALPRFASTGDTFDVRAVVQTVGGHTGRVRVRAEASGPIELTGAQEQTVDLQAGRAAEVVFPGSVGAPGEAKFRFVATAISGFDGTDSVEMTVPVKFPAAKRSLVETGTVNNKDGEGYGTTWRRIDIPDGIRQDTGGVEIEISASALSELLPGLEYLVAYPYGCVEQTTSSTLPLVAMTQITGDFELPGIADGDVKRFAQAGLDRLFTMQTSDGGLGYWPSSNQAHPWGSAYGALALVQASKIDGLEVDRDKLDRLLGYLGELLRGEVETPEYWSLDRLSLVKPFAAYVLALAGTPDASFHEVMFDARSDLPDFGRALLALAITEAGGPVTRVDTLLTELVSGARVDGAEAALVDDYDGRWWMSMHSQIRSSALVLLALMQTRPNDELVTKFARGLLHARRGSRWVSTQDNAFAILALTRYFKQVERTAPDFYAVVGLGDETLLSEHFVGRDLKPRRITIPMRELVRHKGEVLAIMRDGQGGPLYYSVRLNYVESKPPTTNFDSGFTLMREYISAEGPDEGKAVRTLRAGQLIKVRLTLVVPENRHYVAVEDPLPSGLEPVNTSFVTTSARKSSEVDAENRSDDWWWWYPMPDFDYIQQLDDRVLLFADDLDNGVYTHTYLARATTLGTFTVPAARVEEMYAPQVYGRTDALLITVQ